MNFTQEEINTEAKRIFKNLKKLGRSMEDCQAWAKISLQINKLKKEQNAVILAHSYQKPEILFSVADFTGDSYALSKKAAETDADKIVFASVLFMGETAKILNPDKKVLMPQKSGCSLAEAITAADVKNLKKKHPNLPVVCYVNTSAEVKAECDVCVTSANVLKIIKNIDSDEIIFLPDKYMAKNIAKMTGKKLISWEGVCIVHENFKIEDIKKVRKRKPHAKILAHTECPPEIIAEVDMAGGTSDMYNFVKSSQADEFMLITECGLTDKFMVEFPEKKFIGTCQICPYMKETSLEDILDVFNNSSKKHEIFLDKSIIKKARKSLDKMIEMSEK